MIGFFCEGYMRGKQKHWLRYQYLIGSDIGAPLQSTNTWWFGNTQIDAKLLKLIYILLYVVACFILQVKMEKHLKQVYILGWLLHNHIFSL